MCGPKICTLCVTQKHLLPNWAIRRAFPSNLAVDVGQLGSRCFRTRCEKSNGLILGVIQAGLFRQHCRDWLFSGSVLHIYNIVRGTNFKTRTKKLP